MLWWNMYFFFSNVLPRAFMNQIKICGDQQPYNF